MLFITPLYLAIGHAIQVISRKAPGRVICMHGVNFAVSHLKGDRHVCIASLVRAVSCSDTVLTLVDRDKVFGRQTYVVLVRHVVGQVDSDGSVQLKESDVVQMGRHSHLMLGIGPFDP